MRFNFLVNIFFLTTAVGCMQPQYLTEINEIDQMTDSLQILQNNMAAIHFDTCMKYKRIINTEIDFVNNHFKITGDTLPLEVGILLGEYKTASKAFTKIEANYSKVNEELNYSLKQLISLKKALTSEIYNETESKSYFTEEKQAFRTINLAANKLLKSASTGHRLYNEHKGQINVLINDLRIKGEAE